MERNKFTIGSLYAGIGGICLGFKNAGFILSWANEYDKNACITYRLNFEHMLYEKDIMKLNPKKLEKIDILTAGFPCQPFSVAGEQKGFEDKRGNHFFRIVKFIKILNPEVIFLENVKNLKGHDKGKTFKIIIRILTSLGYFIHYSVLNTLKYGNIPQNRERIYIVCFKNKEHYDRFRFPEEIELTKRLKDLIEKEKVDDKYYYDENKYMYNELIEKMVNGNSIYQWRRIYVRENKNNVCPTLTANMGTGGHNVPLIKTKHGIRKLIPEECFRFQGFPDSFILPSNIPTSQLYKQIGNSVSVPVIERIARNIFNVLNSGYE
jgi:DNA (cytosine-5)-methyltransferase 1